MEIIVGYFSVFYILNVCCVYSLESPHRGLIEAILMSTHSIHLQDKKRKSP